MYLKPAGCVANSVEPDQMSCFVPSDLGVLCLLRPVCQNTEVTMADDWICEVTGKIFSYPILSRG